MKQGGFQVIAGIEATNRPHMMAPKIQRSPPSPCKKLPLEALIYELSDLSPPDLEAQGRSVVAAGVLSGTAIRPC